VVAEYPRAGLNRADLVAALAGSDVTEHSPQATPRSRASA
jgi:simple sugar transport system ATP-binding protein